MSIRTQRIDLPKTECIHTAKASHRLYTCTRGYIIKLLRLAAEVFWHKQNRCVLLLGGDFCWQSDGKDKCTHRTYHYFSVCVVGERIDFAVALKLCFRVGCTHICSTLSSFESMRGGGGLCFVNNRRCMRHVRPEIWNSARLKLI